MKVKICGITNVEDALLAESFGADFVGLIFARSSPRAVDRERARRIVEALSTAKPVGVFVEQSIAEVEEIARDVGLYGVQLYRRPSRPARGVRTIRAIRVRDRRSFASMRSGAADYFLLDAHNGRAMGGTGLSFDWSLLPDRLNRVFLAGGIGPANVRLAAKHRPFAVDVCSGVESEPGIKDAAKLRRLFEEIGR